MDGDPLISVFRPRHLAISAVMPYFVGAVRLHRPTVMAQDSARASHQKKFTPLGIVFTVAGVLLFAYFVRKAGVGQILDGIKKLGFGFVLIIAISSIRHIVRSLSWMLCFDGPERLRFWDALRGRLMGDALGNMVGFASALVSEPAKPAMIRDRVPLMAGLTAIAIENIFYAFSVFVSIFSGMALLLLSFDLPKPLRIAGQVTLIIIPFLIALLYLFVRRQYRFISGVLGFLHRRGLSERWVEHGRTLEDSVYGFYRRSGSRFLPILLLEACFHMAGVLEIYVTLSFISLALAPTLLTAFILESVNRVINVVFKFVPFRVGVDEGGTSMVAVILGFTEATGVTLAIIRKGRDVFWTLVGIVLLIQRSLSLRALARSESRAISEAALTEPRVPS